MMLVNGIRDLFIQKYKVKDFNGAGLLEIIGASFIANEEVIFGNLDLDYCIKELKWYNSKSRNVYDMLEPPSIWKEIADKDGKINSNYGWCIFSDDNFNQFYEVVRTLKKNPNSRQGCMIYNRPSMHSDSTAGGMKDFMCTNAVNYFIRDNKVHCTVQMRSNDAVYGYKNDRYWQKYVLGLLAKELNVEEGLIYWQTGSIHIYPRHFKLLDEYLAGQILARPLGGGISKDGKLDKVEYDMFALSTQIDKRYKG